MTAPPHLARVEVTRTPLGAIARPARGRAPVPRFSYAVCTDDAVDVVASNRLVALVNLVGPLRWGGADVAIARGRDAVEDLLDRLEDLGQGTDVLTEVAGAFDAVEAKAYRLGLTTCLVVAFCNALTGQAAASVGAS